MVAVKPNLEFFSNFSYKIVFDTQDSILVWISCFEKPFLDFQLFVHVVVQKQLPWHPNCKILKYFQTPFIYEPGIKLCLSWKPRYWNLYLSCWGGCYGVKFEIGNFQQFILQRSFWHWKSYFALNILLWKAISWFLTFAPVVAREEFPCQPKFNIQKVLSKPFHTNQTPKLYLD